MTFKITVSRRNSEKNSVSQIYRHFYCFLSRFSIKTTDKFKKKKKKKNSESQKLTFSNIRAK